MNTYWLTQEEYEKVVELEQVMFLREHDALVQVVPACRDNENFITVACGSSSSPVDGLMIMWLEDTQP